MFTRDRISAGGTTSRKPRLPMSLTLQPARLHKRRGSKKSEILEQTDTQESVDVQEERRDSAKAATPQTAFTHVAETSLYVQNLEQSTEFYTSVLGLQASSKDSRRVVLPLQNASAIVLYQLGQMGEEEPVKESPEHGPTQGIIDALIDDTQQLRQRFCLAVPDKNDVRRWEEYLHEKAVEVVGRVKQDGECQSMYFRDPDGNLGEIALRHS